MDHELVIPGPSEASPLRLIVLRASTGHSGPIRRFNRHFLHLSTCASRACVGHVGPRNVWYQVCNQNPSMLRSEQVSEAIKSGVNQKIADGHNLYLVVKNGKGFWVYQFRDGNVIRSKGLGSAARVTPAQARRARETFAVARREGFEIPAAFAAPPRGDKFAVADRCLPLKSCRRMGRTPSGRTLAWCGCTQARSPTYR